LVEEKLSENGKQKGLTKDTPALLRLDEKKKKQTEGTRFRGEEGNVGDGGNLGRSV